MSTVGPDGQLYDWCVNALVVTVCRRPRRAPGQGQPAPEPLPPPPPIPVPPPTLPGNPPGTQEGPIPGQGTGTDTQSQSDAEAGTEADVCTQGCPNCPPAQAGAASVFTYAASATGISGAAYQARVTAINGVGGLFPHNPAARQITEWMWSGIRWDGLVPPSCHLLEAKWDHSSWFSQDDWTPSGRPFPRDRFVRDVLLPKIYAEALAHYAAVKANQPYVMLTWHFSALVFKIFFVEWMLGPLTPSDMSLIVLTRHLP